VITFVPNTSVIFIPGGSVTLMVLLTGMLFASIVILYVVFAPAVGSFGVIVIPLFDADTLLKELKAPVKDPVESKY